MTKEELEQKLMEDTRLVEISKEDIGLVASFVATASMNKGVTLNSLLKIVRETLAKYELPNIANVQA